MVVFSRSRSMINTFYFSEIHVNRDVILVCRPYDEGSVVRPTPRVQVIDLPLSIKTLQLPDLDASLGDTVRCLYGTGRVVEIRPAKQQVVVRLHSWELATAHNQVTCYLNMRSVTVVGAKKVHAMTAEERIEYAQSIKVQAEQAVAAKDFTGALEIYQTVLQDLEYDNLSPSAKSSKVKADLVLLQITCSNNAATCCSQLQHYEEASKFAAQALKLLENVAQQRSKRVHKLLNDAGYTDAKLLGDWKVKALLVVAKNLVLTLQMEEASKVLATARQVIAQYSSSTTTASGTDNNVSAVQRNLALSDKQARKLERACDKSIKAQLKTAKKQQRKVFGARSNVLSNSSNVKKTVLGKSTGGGANKVAKPRALGNSNLQQENYATERLEI